jgi:hypothetical protein
MLGGLGQLFKNPARLYVYPHLDLASGHKLTVENFPIPAHLRHLYAHLRENGFIQGIENSSAELLAIRSQDVLAKIRSGDSAWEQLVPAPIAKIIKRDGLFGYRGTPVSAALSP